MFYYNDNGTPVGPVPLSEIRAKIAAGKITPDTLMWKVGAPRWLTAKEIAEVAALLGSAPQSAFDAKAYVVGTWKSEERTRTGQPAFTFSFAADGTMTAKGGTVINGVEVQLGGTYTLEQTKPKSVTMQWKLSSKEGGNFVSLSDTRSFDIVDERTMRDAKDHETYTRSNSL